MAGIFENEFGSITISSSVISAIAGSVATKCYGVVGMAFKNTKDGIVNLLKAGNISKGIQVSFDEADALNIDLHIIVQYGVNISAICQSIMNNVKYQVTTITGLEVENVNVYVESVRVAND
ncbi:MAG: Asp23/Gls24 family envelope stress response protein [Oscillospiraceae bacterium]|nr:Asp23/Gls24 family envelope stress response protein [Oscillospiraceae bacterium]